MEAMKETKFSTKVA